MLGRLKFPRIVKGDDDDKPSEKEDKAAETCDVDGGAVVEEEESKLEESSSEGPPSLELMLPTSEEQPHQTKYTFDAVRPETQHGDVARRLDHDNDIRPRSKPSPLTRLGSRLMMLSSPTGASEKEVKADSSVVEEEARLREESSEVPSLELLPSELRHQTIEAHPNTAQQQPKGIEPEEENKPIKLYKSPRLKGYITIVLAAGINFNSVQRSEISTQPKVVPSTPEQRQYGLAVCTVDMILATVAILCHLDRITPLKRLWISSFRPKSRIELVLVLFLSIWNAIALGIQTSVTGIAGDGKGQYNIYFSIWIMSLTSFWILERWWVDYGWSSFREFISSWPYRAPAWICIMFLSFFDMIWSVDLWKNFDEINPTSSYAAAALEMFNQVPLGEWEWLVTLTVLTFVPAIAFVTIELFRDTNADGSTKEKSKLENILEGATFLILVLAWIPTVGWVTTPKGAASLIGNSYFFTWTLVVFLFEGSVWWIHDYRYEIREALKAKQKEYRKHQKEVLAKTRERQQREKRKAKHEENDSSGDREIRLTLSEPPATKTIERENTEYFEVSETES